MMLTVDGINKKNFTMSMSARDCVTAEGGLTFKWKGEGEIQDVWRQLQPHMNIIIIIIIDNLI